MPVQENYNNLIDQNAAIPRTIYTVLIREVEQKPTKAFAPMDKFLCEIIGPDSVPLGDTIVPVAGRTFEFYVPYTIKTRKRNIGDLRNLMGLVIPDKYEVPTEDEVRAGTYTRIPEIQDATKTLVGCTLQMELGSEEYYKTDTGDWRGKAILDESGQRIVAGHKIIGDLSAVKSQPANM